MTKSAKEILLLNLQTLIPEVKNAVEIVLKELDAAEEKISEFEKEKNLLSIRGELTAEEARVHPMKNVLEK